VCVCVCLHAPTYSPLLSPLSLARPHAVQVSKPADHVYEPPTEGDDDSSRFVRYELPPQFLKLRGVGATCVHACACLVQRCEMWLWCRCCHSLLVSTCAPCTRLTRQRDVPRGQQAREQLPDDRAPLFQGSPAQEL
jgi:hypothetical protein